MLQWNPDRAHENHTQIIPAACGRFHAVILQEVVDHVPHISECFHTNTDGNDLAISLNKDTFVSGAAVVPISEASTSKGTWGLAALVVRGSVRRSSVADSPTVTFCSVHLHNTVAEKRDASTSFFQRFRGHMVLQSVDVIVTTST